MKSRTVAFMTIGTLSFVQAVPAGHASVMNPALIASVRIAAQPQALKPPYLSEMPSVDRVMSAMQTADPRETALRQIGSFYQLMEIIKTLSGPREFRGLTPDEGRIMQTYNVAQYNVAQVADKSFAGPPGGSIKFSETNPYHYGRWDRRFGVVGIQTFKTFFSPALKAEFDRIVGADNARREARTQPPKNDAAAPQQAAGPVKPGGQAEMRRCIESGRSQRVCFTEVLNNGMDQMSGISTKPPITPGPRITGDYSSPGGFRLIFQPDKVTMVCKGVPAPRPYSVELTEDQANVKIQNEGKTVVFALRQDGKMAASGPIRVTGQVAAGSSTEQTAGMTTQKTTRQRELTPLEAQNYPGAKQNGQTYTTTEDATELVYGPSTRTIINYVTKTADCTLGLMTATGPTPLPPDMESPFGLITTIFSGASVLMNGGSKEAAFGEMLNLDKAQAPGLRMSGRFAGESGFSITFHPESATVACGDVERAHEYSMQRNANQVLLKIQDKSNPIALQLKPDGSLFGEGSVQVNGRVIVGTTEDPKNPFVFAPRTGSCTVGSLVSGGPIATNRPASTATPAASPSAVAAPTAPGSNQGPANVSLSIVSGFATQPGVVNPLAGATVIVIKESFENILAKAGSIPPGSSTTALTAWARACETRNPLCQQGIEAVRPYVVANAKLDGNGGVTLTNARMGTYYLVLQIPYNGLHLVWNLRVDLKPGANTVTLDQRNTTSIDR